MATVNENWPRWIMASIAKHFDDNLSDIAVFIEGQDRNLRTEERIAEIRMDGPWFTQYDKTQWKVFIEINILVQTSMATDVNDESKDIYQSRRDVGQVAAAFATAIRTYKYGPDVGDDDSLLGCLILVSDTKGKKRIQINHFGRVEPKTDVEQSSVEAHYEMILENV